MEYNLGLTSDTCISVLQSSRYRDFDDFHVDMMLVKENCCLYNPEQSAVRKDCDEVFAYYQQEYDKLMDKWQKVDLFIPFKLHSSKDLKEHCVFCHWSQYKVTHSLTHNESWINKAKTCFSCDKFGYPSRMTC